MQETDISNCGSMRGKWEDQSQRGDVTTDTEVGMIPGKGHESNLWKLVEARKHSPQHLQKESSPQTPWPLIQWAAAAAAAKSLSRVQLCATP